MILIHLAKDLFVKYARFFELNKKLLEIEAIFDMSASILLASILALFFVLGPQISYSQSEQQNFTEPRFGISMQYPAKWSFVPAEEEKEEQDYAAGHSASVGTFCPTASLESILGGPDCGPTVPIRLQISVYKLEEGTTSKEFYDFKMVPF